MKDSSAPLRPTAALAQARRRLSESAKEDAPFDARLLLEHVTGQPLAALLAHDHAPLADAQAAQFFALVERRAMGEPTAYLTGTAYFYGRPFAVRPGVLIPRRDTEVLLQAALRRMAPCARVLDLCCGSGCLAVTAALERPGARLFAGDLSPTAVETTRENAARHGVPVDVRRGDLFAPFAGQRFDVIVTNPPYIAEGDGRVERQVRAFEPALALYAGEDGLSFYRRIAAQAACFLTRGGAIYLEHGDAQRQAVEALFAAQGFQRLERIDDLEGRARALGFQRGDA